MSRRALLLALLGCAVHCEGAMMISGLSRKQFSLRPTSLRALKLRGGSGDEKLGDPFKMKLAELHKELKNRGLSTAGLKDECAKRLQDAQQDASSGNKRPASDVDEQEHPVSKHGKFDDTKFTEDFEGGDAPPTESGVVKSIVQDETPVQVMGDEESVRIYNCYHLKDNCRLAGFKWDAEEKAWAMPTPQAKQLFKESDIDAIRVDDVVEILVNEYGEAAQAAAAAQPVEREPVLVAVDAGVVRITGGTYDLRNALRAAQFRWDPPTSAWTNLLPEVREWLAKAGRAADITDTDGEDFKKAIVETLEENKDVQPPPARSPDPATAVPPSLSIEDEQVVVRNSYDIKDHLRGLGFRFSAQLKAWCSPVSEVMKLSKEFTQASDISVESLLVLDAKVDINAERPPPAEPKVRIAEENFEVLNSYAIKDQLRALGFRWQQDRQAWSCPVDQVLATVGVAEADKVTAEMLREVGEAKRLELEGQPQAEKTPPRIEITMDNDGAESVEVHNSYDIKDQLRTLGFRWSSEKSAWVRSLNEVLGMYGAQPLTRETLTVENLLAMDPIPMNELPAGGRSGSPDLPRPVPSIKIAEGQVRVANSYDIKDQLRGLGFRWNAEAVSWSRSTVEVLALLSVSSPSEITVEKLLSAKPDPSLLPPPQEELNKSPVIECDNDQVLVYNSYHVKEQLRKLSFTFDQDRRAWVKPLYEVKMLTGIEDQDELTLDMLLTKADEMGDADLPPPGGYGMGHGLSGGGVPASPEPDVQDQTPGETLMSSMGHSLQGWTPSTAQA